MGTSTAIPPAYRHGALLLLAPATAWHGWSRTVFAVSLPNAWARAVQARQAWRVVLIGWAGRASAAPALAWYRADTRCRQEQRSWTGSEVQSRHASSSEWRSLRRRPPRVRCHRGGAGAACPVLHGGASRSRLVSLVPARCPTSPSCLGWRRHRVASPARRCYMAVAAGPILTEFSATQHCGCRRRQVTPTPRHPSGHCMHREHGVQQLMHRRMTTAIDRDRARSERKLHKHSQILKLITEARFRICDDKCLQHTALFDPYSTASMHEQRFSASL